MTSISVSQFALPILGSFTDKELSTLVGEQQYSPQGGGSRRSSALLWRDSLAAPPAGRWDHLIDKTLAGGGGAGARGVPGTLPS